MLGDREVDDLGGFKRAGKQALEEEHDGRLNAEVSGR
jgi:hypothetical protein